MDPAIVIPDGPDAAEAERHAWERFPDAEVLVQSGTLMEVLVRAVGTHRPRIVVLGQSSLQGLNEVSAVFLASEHADIALGQRAVCWRRDTLSTALITPAPFARMRGLMRRAAARGATFLSLARDPDLASRRPRVLSLASEADEAARTRG